MVEWRILKGGDYMAKEPTHDVLIAGKVHKLTETQIRETYKSLARILSHIATSAK